MEKLKGLSKLNGKALSELQKLAKEKGTTLYAIAKKYGIKRPTVYAWAQNPRKMKIEQVELVARELGITVSELVEKLTK